MVFLHAVIVGGSTTVTVNHQFIALVKLAFLLHLLVYPSQRRLELCAGSLVILYRDGIKIDRSLFRAALNDDAGLVGSDGRQVQLFLDVHIDVKVFRHPLSEPIGRSKVYSCLLVELCLAVFHRHAHLSFRVV